MTNFNLISKQFDLIIIGSGGAGLMAAITAFDAGIKNIAIISKVVPTSSHTVAAKGGINAALGNVVEDDWKWHAFDTIKGADYLADKAAVDLLCQNAASAIIELEKMGVVFSRDSNGKIAQRAYGGQTIDFGKGAVAYRACYSKDKTGQTILHTLYSEALRRDIKFFSEFFVTDLLIDDVDFNDNSSGNFVATSKQCGGCLAIDLNAGELYGFFAPNVIIASGGYSQIYRNTTSSTICTGDGQALILKESLPLQDMEFVQFHPTGIFAQGFLITEAARGEGAYLLNAQGERFMKNYAPKMMELASRDVISRAIANEIVEGRGCGEGKNYIHLDLRHLSEETLTGKLPGVIEIAKNFAKVDVRKEPIAIAPTAHYTMGGIPTNIDCEVLDKNLQPVRGLMAVGEAACVSVHGANRLGCNSLLDLIVFGKIAGKKAAKNSVFNSEKFKNIIADKALKLKALLSTSQNQAEQISLAKLKTNLQNANEKHLAVFRNQTLLEQGLSTVEDLFKTFKNHKIKNKSLLWNNELVDYFELENLFLNSLAAFNSALARQESRGAHYREDYPQKDDVNWLKHSLVRLEKNGSVFCFSREVETQ